MSGAKFSIIVPTYNGAKFLGETIESVLKQTWTDFELIIVNDASPDQTTKVVKQFNDPRIRYIVHDANKGSDVARHTGLHASVGEIIAFLDQDDLFHPEKLAAHVAYMNSHPDVGVTYNARFEMNHSATTIREVWRPPRNVTLGDLVVAFPLAPSDVVFRRKWALEMDLIKGSFSWTGGEIVHYGGLYMSGCKFAYIDRALNYRRYHSGRITKDLVGGCEAEINAQNKIFSDPRCPVQVSALRGIAHSNIYMMWAFRALVQEETALSHKFLREAVRSNPSILKGNPCRMMSFLLLCSVDDENLDHEILLGRIVTQFPPELAYLSEQSAATVARGYWIKGVRAIMWNRPEDGTRYLARAIERRVQFDQFLMNQLGQTLLNYGIEFGDELVQKRIESLAPYLEKLEGRALVRQVTGDYLINRAFQRYRVGEYAQVLGNLVSGLAVQPKNLGNRGMWSVFVRSLFRVPAESA